MPTISVEWRAAGNIVEDTYSHYQIPKNIIGIMASKDGEWYKYSR